MGGVGGGADVVVKCAIRQPFFSNGAHSARSFQLASALRVSEEFQAKHGTTFKTNQATFPAEPLAV